MPNMIYESVGQFFKHDDPHTDPERIGALPPRFGLIDSSSERWSVFSTKLAHMNAEAPAGTSYKVFFFGRHGEGYHNVAEKKYGTKAWDEYWSKLNGDGEITWGPDPELTQLGEQQATDARGAWERELSFGIPLPQRLYVSPLTRAMVTAIKTFDGIITDVNRKPMVIEYCREENGVHTCDKRRSRSYISSTFARFDIEEGLTEEDELWDSEVRESKPEVLERAKVVLNRIFSEDQETFVSITAHGGIINMFLAAIGRPWFPLPTGGVIPVVIKCTSH